MDSLNSDDPYDYDTLAASSGPTIYKDVKMWELGNKGWVSQLWKLDAPSDFGVSELLPSRHESWRDHAESDHQMRELSGFLVEILDT